MPSVFVSPPGIGSTKEEAFVMLTAQKLDEMQRVNIGAVAADTLADVSGLRLDNTLSHKERLARFLNTAENLYCFCVGGVGVKIEFAKDGPALQDALAGFLLRQKSGL